MKPATVLILLIVMQSACALGTFPRNEYEWIWCFGREAVEKRLGEDLNELGLMRAEINWSFMENYLQDDSFLRPGEFGSKRAHHETIRYLGETGSKLKTAKGLAARNGLEAKVDAIDMVQPVILSYTSALETGFADALASDIKLAGLDRLDEIMRFEKHAGISSPSKLLELANIQANSEAGKAGVSSDMIMQFLNAWRAYLDIYTEFSRKQHSLLMQQKYCNQFRGYTLMRCDDNALVNALRCVGSKGVECGYAAACASSFAEEFRYVSAHPPDMAVLFEGLKTYSPLEENGRMYAAFISFMKQAYAEEERISKENLQLIEGLDGSITRAEELGLDVVDPVIFQELNRLDGGPASLKPKEDIENSPAETLEAAKFCAEDAGILLENVRHEFYAGEGYLYRRLSELKNANGKLRQRKESLEAKIMFASELESKASVFIIRELLALEEKSLRPEEIAILEDLKGVRFNSSLGENLKTAHAVMLKLAGLKKRITMNEEDYYKLLAEELSNKTKELFWLAEIGGSPRERRFGKRNGFEICGEDVNLAAGKEKIKKLPEEIESAVKLETAEKPEALHRLKIAAAAIEELVYDAVDGKYATGLNSNKLFVAKTFNDLEYANLSGTAEAEKQIYFGLLNISGSEWVCARESFGFMAFLDEKYSGLATALRGKLAESEKRILQGLDLTIQSNPVGEAVAGKPLLIRSEITVKNPTQIGSNESFSYRGLLEFKPISRISNTNLLDSSSGIESVSSIDSALDVKLGGIEPYSVERAILEYSTGLPARVEMRAEEQCTVDSYAWKTVINVACAVPLDKITVPVELPKKFDVVHIGGENYFPMGKSLELAVNCTTNQSITIGTMINEPIEIFASERHDEKENSYRQTVFAKNRQNFTLMNAQLRLEAPANVKSTDLDGKLCILKNGTLSWESSFSPLEIRRFEFTFRTQPVDSGKLKSAGETIRELISGIDCKNCCDIRKKLEAENEKIEATNDPEKQIYEKWKLILRMQNLLPKLKLIPNMTYNLGTDKMAEMEFLLCEERFDDVIELLKEKPAKTAEKAVTVRTEERIVETAGKKTDEPKVQAAKISASGIPENKTKELQNGCSRLQANFVLFRRRLSLIDKQIDRLELFGKTYPEISRVSDAEGNITLAGLKTHFEKIQKRAVEIESKCRESEFPSLEHETELLEGLVMTKQKEYAETTAVEFGQNSTRLSIPKEIIDQVEEKYGKLVGETQDKNPKFFDNLEKKDYDSALQLAVQYGFDGKNTDLEKQSKMQLALAESRLKELKTDSKEVALLVEQAKAAQKENRYGDALYLSLYAQDKAQKLQNNVKPAASNITLVAGAILLGGLVFYLTRNKNTDETLEFDELEP